MNKENTQFVSFFSNTLKFRSNLTFCHHNKKNDYDYVENITHFPQNFARSGVNLEIMKTAFGILKISHKIESDFKA